MDTSQLYGHKVNDGIFFLDLPMTEHQINYNSPIHDHAQQTQDAATAWDNCTRQSSGMPRGNLPCSSCLVLPTRSSPPHSLRFDMPMHRNPGSEEQKTQDMILAAGAQSKIG
jgi:hypothetical protein